MSAGVRSLRRAGPRARLRAHLYTALFTLVLLAVAWFVFRGFADKNQWNGALWKPFIEGATWSEFLLPGLLNTIEAALLSVVIAIPHRRTPRHRPHVGAPLGQRALRCDRRVLPRDPPSCS